MSERAEEEEEATRRIEREQGPEPKSEPDIAAPEIIETGKGAHEEEGEGGESNPERDWPEDDAKTDPVHIIIDRSIDPPLMSTCLPGPASPTTSTASATIFSASSSSAAAAEAGEEEEEEQGPTSVRMQHELSQSGSFASSQGSPIAGGHVTSGEGGSGGNGSGGDGGKKQKSRKKKKKKQKQKQK